MLTNSSEEMLKQLLSVKLTEELKEYTPEDCLPLSFAIEQSRFASTDKAEEALNLLLTEDYIEQPMEGLIRITSKGRAYFELKRKERKVWLLEKWAAPFATGFLSGVLVTLIGTALVRWLLHQ